LKLLAIARIVWNISADNAGETGPPTQSHRLLVSWAHDEMDGCNET